MPSPAQPLRIGTRGSPLALTQAGMVRDALAAAHGWNADALTLVVVRTSGDRIQDRPLADLGGKALWTRELDRALLAGEIDLAVHSLKDVETERPATLQLVPALPRADARDRLIGAESLAALPPDPRVGTASPRRAAQVLRARPDARIALFRGNVDTRLAKLAAGEADATLLAAAGLERLGRSVGTPVPIDVMLPAPAQGAIGVETVAGSPLLPLVHAIRHAPTAIAVEAERAVLAALGATCHSPVAAHAIVADGRLWLRAELLTAEGRERVAGEIDGRDAAARALATSLAHRLLGQASPALGGLFDPP